MSVAYAPIPAPAPAPIQEHRRNISATSIDSALFRSSIDAPGLQERLTTIVEKKDVNEKASMGVEICLTDSELSTEDEAFLESQPVATETPTPVEYTVPYQTKLIYLALYFMLNLTLTLSNKGIMQQVKTPWLLTVIHATATSIGTGTLAATGHLKLSKLGTKENLILVGFSSLFTLNIAVSNVSLALVSVPFHQIARSTCPVVTALIYRTVFQRSYERQTYLSMIPLVAGVGLATVGDYYVTGLGFAMTILGVVLASVKTVTTNRLMTGPLALPPLEILFRMSPLAAAQCFFYAAISGEFSQVRTALDGGSLGLSFFLVLAMNAIFAFFLNTVSFTTNKLAGALTMSVCGNLKQCLTIILGIVLFSVKVTPLNGFGMLVALTGAAWYSRVELLSKKAPK